jgi:threonine synthase
MNYVSTRGLAPILNFEDTMVSGLARDGGLYVPETWPRLSPDDIKGLRGKTYAEVAFSVIRPFIGLDIPDADLRAITKAAYATFAHDAVAPLKQLAANHFLLELFHGPTIAFKDVAMQLLVRLMDRAFAKRDHRLTIIGATSGDTGGAAVEAFQHSTKADLFILFPDGRVSDVQRRQMTTVQSPNVHNIAIKGTFDDCQAIVKALFNDLAFRDRVHLTGVNSINWARVMAQIPYYFFAALALGSPDRPVTYCVPTGNFGNIFAGFAAKRMGLPIDRLIIATNANDILDRTVKTGRHELGEVYATSSPSMDIQISSNFERLVYLAGGQDSAALRRHFESLKQSGGFTLEDPVLHAIRHEFDSGRASDAEAAQTMRATLAATGELLDPHTAVGVHVASQHTGITPVITLATAHPAKFPAFVSEATGVYPDLPQRLKHLMNGKESFKLLENSADVVKAFVLDRVRL